MNTVLAAFALLVIVIGGLVVLRRLLIGRIPEYPGLDSDQLQEYVRYLRRALAPGGQVEIQAIGLQCPFKLQKLRGKTPSQLVLTLSSGRLGREAVSRASALLQELGIKHSYNFTRVKRWPHRVRIPFNADDPLTGPAVCSVIFRVSEMLRPDQSKKYSVVCWGPFLAGFPPEDGKVLAYPTSWQAGYSVGKWVAAIVRLFRGIW